MERRPSRSTIYSPASATGLLTLDDELDQLHSEFPAAHCNAKADMLLFSEMYEEGHTDYNPYDGFLQ